MNIELLKSAYAGNSAVKAICDHLAGRDYNQKETKLHRIIQHLEGEAYDFKRGEMISAFRKLEEAGAGKYVEGRHGWPSRFVWETKTLYISSLASNDETAKLPPTDIEITTTELEEEADFIEHSFALRPEVVVSFELPSNLSKGEAARLAKFFESLPFEDA